MVQNGDKKAETIFKNFFGISAIRPPLAVDWSPVRWIFVKLDGTFDWNFGILDKYY